MEKIMLMEENMELIRFNDFSFEYSNNEKFFLS